MSAASGGIRSKKWLVDQPASPRNRAVGIRHAEGRVRREAEGEIATSWPGGVLAAIRGGRGAEDWTAAEVEPSILRHGRGGRNGEFFWWLSIALMADGSLSSRSNKMAVGKF